MINYNYSLGTSEQRTPRYSVLGPVRDESDPAIHRGGWGWSRRSPIWRRAEPRESAAPAFPQQLLVWGRRRSTGLWYHVLLAVDERPPGAGAGVVDAAGGVGGPQEDGLRRL